MPKSVYKVIEIIGSSENSWEEAVNNAVNEAAKTLKDLRICEVEKLDVKLQDNKIISYRARVKLSFKYIGEGD
jgi:flavin-binding protein dodecin